MPPPSPSSASSADDAAAEPAASGREAKAISVASRTSSRMPQPRPPPKARPMPMRTPSRPDARARRRRRRPTPRTRRRSQLERGRPAGSKAAAGDGAAVEPKSKKATTPRPPRALRRCCRERAATVPPGEPQGIWGRFRSARKPRGPRPEPRRLTAPRPQTETPGPRGPALFAVRSGLGGRLAIDRVVGLVDGLGGLVGRLSATSPVAEPISVADRRRRRSAMRPRPRHPRPRRSHPGRRAVRGSSSSRWKIGTHSVLGLRGDLVAPARRAHGASPRRASVR